MRNRKDKRDQKHAKGLKPAGRIGGLLFILLSAMALATSRASAQTLTTLYSFTGGSDGAYPYAGLITDASGNLYSTTEEGGASNAGTVFKLTPAGTESVLYSFTGASDGGYPLGGLILNTSGNLYGTTQVGGANNAGAVFELTPTETESVLYSFTGGSDGLNPFAGLIADASGNLYGTTSAGGASNAGTVFKLTPTGSETVLYSFAGGSDGSSPSAGLIADASGNLYGTTQAGGPSNAGTVFKLTPTGSETVLYSFTGGSDGWIPFAGLIADASGNLYGTTQAGGPNYRGTVFKVTPTGAETVLYSFTGGSDGAYPQAGLIADASGNLYGTTPDGGTSNSGTIFKLTPTGTETVLYSFTGASDGAVPSAGLIADASGNLYGTTPDGGTNGTGTVFKLSGSGFVPPAPPTPLASLSPVSLSFGSQTVGTTSGAQTVTLTNTGGAPLHVTGVAATNGFATTNNCVKASPLAANGSCTESVTFVPTSTGAQTGSVIFTDDSGGKAGSIQGVSLSGTAVKATTTTSVTSISPSSSVAGQTVTVNFSASPQAGNSLTPSGAVTVNATTGESCTGSAPAGSCALTFATAGSRTITASYGGDSNFLGSTSAGVTQNVGDFSISASPASQTVSPGRAATYTLTLTSLGGLSGSVGLSCSGGPPNSTCTMSPGSVTLSGTSKVTVSKATNHGTFTLTFTGSYGSGSPATGGLTHTASASLTVK